uniref:PKS_AT domain-containing protein n=1 Tax=Parastrongyloides trichosuri TaxID=131310 RepID=A0A0N4ZR83_PARTI
MNFQLVLRRNIQLININKRFIRGRINNIKDNSHNDIKDFLNNNNEVKMENKKQYLKEINFSHIPIEKQAIIFCPGQGAQTVGMLEKTKKENPKALKLFDEASEILGYDLQKVIDNGPDTKLNQTIYTQPAILVSTIVGYENLKLIRPDINDYLTHIAGFSVGEYSAAVISGMLTFPNAVKIVKARAEAMHKCCQYTSSKMIVVSTKASSRLGDLMDDALKFATEINGVPLCEIANILYTGHKVVGMSDDCYEYIKKYSEDYDVKLGKILSVGGAFHTRLMSDAVNELKPLFKNLDVEVPFCNIYSNFTGKIMERKKRQIRVNLLNQICNPVKWEQIQQLIYRQHEKENERYIFPTYYEVGPGKTLGAMWYKISKKAFKNYFHISC